MLTKMKIAIVLCGSLLVGGVAAAQGVDNGTGADRRAKMQAMKAAKLAKFDTNKDGKLDKGERTVMRDQRLTTRFQKLDADSNGVITLAEFKAGKHKHGKRHARFGRGMKRGPGTR